MPFCNPLKQGFPRRACRAPRQANPCGGFIHDQFIEAVCPTGTQFLDPMGIGLETQALWPGQSPHPRVVRSPVRPVAPAGRSPAARAGAGARSEISAPLKGSFSRRGRHPVPREYHLRSTRRADAGKPSLCPPDPGTGLGVDGGDRGAPDYALCAGGRARLWTFTARASCSMHGGSGLLSSTRMITCISAPPNSGAISRPSRSYISAPRGSCPVPAQPGLRRAVPGDLRAPGRSARSMPRLTSTPPISWTSTWRLPFATRGRSPRSSMVESLDGALCTRLGERALRRRPPEGCAREVDHAAKINGARERRPSAGAWRAITSG